MNKQKLILFGIFLFTLMFSTLINAEVYNTPGFSGKYGDSFSIENQIEEVSNVDVNESLIYTTEKDYSLLFLISWKVSLILIIIVSSYKIINYYLTKKRKRNKVLAPFLKSDALKEMDRNKDVPDELDEIFNELELEEMNDEKEEVYKYEP